MDRAAIRKAALSGWQRVETAVVYTRLENDLEIVMISFGVWRALRVLGGYTRLRLR